MAQPNQWQIKAGATVYNAPMAPGAAPVMAKLGDIVTHPGGGGWHVCVCPIGLTVAVPTGGLKAGESTDNWHWSVGASYSGSGVSHPVPATATYDAVSHGIGTDAKLPTHDSNNCPQCQALSITGGPQVKRGF